MRRSRPRVARLEAGGSDFDEALAAASPEALRAVIADTRLTLEPDARRRLEARVVRAAVGEGGWRPAPRDRRLIEDVRAFVAAALRVGSADPDDVEGFLADAVSASLAGQPEVARQVFEALLPPVMECAIDLGHDELLGEVLSELDACAAHYLLSVYRTTPPDARPEALDEASWAAAELGYLPRPLAAMEAALGGELPGLDAFLPAWIARLRRVGARERYPRSEWIHEAIARHGGTRALAEEARRTRSYGDLTAWVDAVQEGGDAAAIRRAAEEAAALSDDASRRAGFLDRVAAASAALGDDRVLSDREAALQASPTLPRLAAWLWTGAPDARAIRRRARNARGATTLDARCEVLLAILDGDWRGAAALLAGAPGLGWSRAPHPGHLAVASFAWRLGGLPAGSVRVALGWPLDQPLVDRWARLDPARGAAEAPTALDLYRQADVATRRVTAADRAAMVDALRTAAERRTEGLTAEKRTRHYPHVAALVALCEELEGGTPRADRQSDWVEAFRARWPRHYGLQREIREALARATRG